MDDTSSSAKPTQTPSWVMLGFVVGVLFMLALPRHAPAPAPAATAPARPSAPEPAAAPAQIATIDAVFGVWGKYAIWDSDTTEVALWNSGTGEFSDCYEVLRVGDTNFFRPIPRLTRPVLHHGVPDAQNAPLEYTETAAQEQEWKKEASDENWRAFSDALHPPATKPKATP
jgi:hypothetical protein